MYAEISTWGAGYSDTLPVGVFVFTGGITNLYTAQAGFICKLGTMNYQESGTITLLWPWDYYFTFSSSYQVISNVTNEIVSAGTFACRVGPIQAAPLGFYSGLRTTYIYDIKNNSVQTGRVGYAAGFNAPFVS